MAARCCGGGSGRKRLKRLCATQAPAGINAAGNKDQNTARRKKRGPRSARPSQQPCRRTVRVGVFRGRGRDGTALPQQNALNPRNANGKAAAQSKAQYGGSSLGRRTAKHKHVRLSSYTPSGISGEFLPLPTPAPS